MKKLTVLLVVLCLCFSSTIVFGDEDILIEQNERQTSGSRYQAITSIDGRLTISKYGKANVVMSARGSEQVSKTVVIAELMQHKNGEWVSIKEWSDSNDMQIAGLSKYYYVAKGYDYKIKGKIYVYDEKGNLLDSTTVYTPIQSY